MKKHVMNKNVHHNGKLYEKGKQIKESDEGFKAIVDKGHADAISFDEEPASDEGGESQEQSSEPGQPSKKSRK